MTQDEVRGLEELNPLGGDAAALPAVTNAPPEPPPPEDTPAAKQAWGVLADLKGRVDTLAAVAAAGAHRAPEVHVKAGDVHVQVPQGSAPVVNTNVTVPPSDVKVDVAAPDVKVDVAPPAVTVAAPDVKVDVAAPIVNMPDTTRVEIRSMPARVTTSEIERDGDNQIVRTSQTEKDA